MKDLKFPRKSRIASHIATLPKSGIRDFFELVMAMDDVISLGVGEPDFPTPWNIREAAIDSLEKGHTSYTSNLGLLSLRREICKYLETDYQVSYDPQTECIITVGVSEALDIAIRALINPGEEVIYSEPCYVSYASEIIMAHGVPVPIACYEDNKFAVNPADIRAAITDKTRVILLNFPCNPTGAVLTQEQMDEIAVIAVEHDLVVITDEIYSELTYGERLPTIAFLPGMRERTLFLHGFSKAFSMTGFRIGYGCGPEDIIDAMMKIHQYSMLCAPIIAQEAAEEALKNSKPAMESMKAEYCERRNEMNARFNAMGLHCVKPGGAFYMFPNITSTGLSSMEFSQRLLEEQNVAAVPGTAFGECGEGFIRCCYAASMSDIVEAMNRIEKFIQQF
jgi:aminotransferase